MSKRFDDLFAALILAAAVAVLLAGFWCLSHSIARAGEAVPPLAEQAPVVTAMPEPAVLCCESADPDPEPEEEDPVYTYDPAIPLDEELQDVLYEACEANGVPVALALGVIEVESCFDPDADNGVCYGLCQLHRSYFPDKLTPADNLRTGIEHLGRLLEQYGDTAAALTAYNAGYDTGRRAYANAVMAAAEWWKEVLA